MLTIEGVTYDTSRFVHPGGDILHSFHGKDATDMFLALHPPDSRARKTLASLPVVARGEHVRTPYQELHAQVMARVVDSGVYDVLVRWWLLEQLSIMGGLTTAWVGLLPWSPCLSCVAYSFAMLHAGWLAHHVMHHQVGPYWPWLIEFVSGYSPAWWQVKHNVLHHSHTNVAGKDTDIDNDIFSFELGQPGFPYQHVVFWPLLCFMRILWCIAGLRHGTWVVQVHHSLVLRLLKHYMSWTMLLRWYAVGNLLSGFMLGFVVVQSHNAETIFQVQGSDHLAHTALTTRNLPSGKFNTFFSGYLNYQIEHHLFPWLPCVFFADIQPLVQKSLATQHLPYTQLSWRESAVKLYRHLREVNTLRKTS